jgi:hemoglobin
MRRSGRPGRIATANDHIDDFPILSLTDFSRSIQMHELVLIVAIGVAGADSCCRSRPVYYSSCYSACVPGQVAVAAPCQQVGATEVRTAQKPVTTAESLYNRLGGAKAIAAVVDDFVARAASNPKVNFTRKGTSMEWEASPENVAVLKKHLIQLITKVTGGAQKYEGRDMKAAHAGMKITDAEFDAIAGDLKATLDKFKVPMKEQQELLKIVGSTRGDIVEKSLYERLGGEKAITAVVDDFVGRAAANPKVNFTRKGTAAEWQASSENVTRLKKHLVQLVAMVTGGPQKYEGRDMKAAHAGMKITNDEFDAIAGDLKATLNKFKVPAKEQEELLKIVGSTREAIVENASP